MLKIFYSTAMSVSSNDSFSPSAGKPDLLMLDLMKTRKDFEIVDITPLERSDLYLVHDKKYVDDVLDLNISNGFSNRSPDVAHALPYVCGSMVQASLDSFQNKSITLSPTSGAHHAGYNFGGGYCTFNFLALAALLVHKQGAKKVGIIDLDCHHGNGTVDIIKKLNFDFIKHYSYGQDPMAKTDKDAWLKKLKSIVQGFLDCDFVIYNAGVDSHITDPLGGYLTTADIKLRDEIVLNILREKNIPITISLAGGYQKDKKTGSIQKVIDLHKIMIDIACDLLNPPIVYGHSYRFVNLINWSHELNQSVINFHANYGVFPNIMLANEYTLSRLDFVANTNQEKIKGGDDQSSPSEFVALSGFKGDGYDLCWCIDNNLADFEYDLIFDSNPGDGIPVSDAEKVKKAKTA